MNKRKRGFSILMVTLGILIFGICFSGKTTWATSATVISNETELLNALKNGGTYTLSTTINTPAGQDTPLIVEKDVSFNGGGINLTDAGILLKANASFNGTTLNFINTAYLGIFANGYDLTLSNLTLDWSSADPLSISAGGVANSAAFSATSGSGGSKITIKNVSAASDQKINIYAGNVYNITPLTMEDSAPAQEVLDTGVDYPVTIEISGTSATKPAVYGHGATHTGFRVGNTMAGNDSFDKIVPESLCSTRGGVTVNLQSGSDVSLVEGATGAQDLGTTVNLTSVNGYSTTLTARNLSSLILGTGGGANPNLKLSNGSIGSSLYSDAAVTVPADTTLDLSGMGDQLTIGSLLGGGSIVLGQNQTLTITGAVTGETKVGIVEITPQGGRMPTEGHTYIVAPSSVETSFVLLPPNTSDLTFTYNSGNWSIPSQSAETAIDKIKTIVIAEGYDSVTVSPDVSTSYEGIQIEWADGVDVEIADMGRIPLEFMYNMSSSSVQRKEVDEYGYYSYTVTINYVAYVMEIIQNKLYFSRDGVPTGLPVGTHGFYLTVPKDYTEDGTRKTVNFTIKSSQTAVDIQKPEAAETPAITKQPAKTAVYVKDAAAAPLQVTASVLDGGKLSYQWYRNSVNNNQSGTVIEGATDYQYTPSTAAVGTVYYYCVVTNTNTEATVEKRATAVTTTAAITVEKAAGTASVKLDGWIYGAVANSPVAASSTNGTAEVTYSYSGTTVRGEKYGPSSRIPVNAGTYTVSATFAATEAYTEVSATDSFTIEQAVFTDSDPIDHQIKTDNLDLQTISLGTAIEVLPGYLAGDTLTAKAAYIGKRLEKVKMSGEILEFRLKSGLTDKNTVSETIDIEIMGMNNYSAVTFKVIITITPEEKPTETPEEKPTETPEEKPTETPEEKPDDTGTPGETPTEIPQDIWASGISEEVPYTGDKIIQSFSLYDGEKLLKERVDYTVAYSNNTRAYEWDEKDYTEFTKKLEETGKAVSVGSFNPKKAPAVIIKMRGNYRGTKTIYFQIRKQNMGEESIKADDLTVTYTGKKQTPVPKVSWNGDPLKYNRDFVVKEYMDYKSDKTAFTGNGNGTQKVELLTLQGKGN